MIATVPLPGLLQPVGGLPPALFFVQSVLLAASLLVFAFGFRGQGSVTALQPLGTAALVVLAAASLLGDFSTLLGSASFDLMMAVANLGLLVQVAAAVVAVVQIGRAGVVPRPWNWAPAWCLAVIVVASLLYQVPAAASDPGLALTIGTLEGLARSGSAIFLGVLAIVLSRTAAHTRTVTVLSDRD